MGSKKKHEHNRKRDEKADVGRMCAREGCVLADKTFASSEDASMMSWQTVDHSCSAEGRHLWLL